MSIALGIWPAECALGEKLYYAQKKAEGYEESRIRDYVKSLLEYPSDQRNYQRRAEEFLKLVGSQGSAGLNYEALFGPVPRTKDMADKIHMLTLAMSADTGKADRSKDSYNPPLAAVMYAIRNPNGTYIAPSGASTKDAEEARLFYTFQEAHDAKRNSTQVIVKV